MAEIVNITAENCYANLEMSGFYQFRNVRFSFYLISSLKWLFSPDL